MTLQQSAATAVMDIAAATIGVLRTVYARLQDRDGRWRTDWCDVAVMVNPNGPLIEAGSDGDNGQTGRKLVMDFYGPRVPIGGGALSGKHLSHTSPLRSDAQVERQQPRRAQRGSPRARQVASEKRGYPRNFMSHEHFSPGSITASHGGRLYRAANVAC